MWRPFKSKDERISERMERQFGNLNLAKRSSDEMIDAVDGEVVEGGGKGHSLARELHNTLAAMDHQGRSDRMLEGVRLTHQDDLKAVVAIHNANIQALNVALEQASKLNQGKVEYNKRIYRENNSFKGLRWGENGLIGKLLQQKEAVEGEVHLSGTIPGSELKFHYPALPGVTPARGSVSSAAMFLREIDFPSGEKQGRNQPQPKSVITQSYDNGAAFMRVERTGIVRNGGMVELGGATMYDTISSGSIQPTSGSVMMESKAGSWEGQFPL